MRYEINVNAIIEIRIAQLLKKEEGYNSAMNNATHKTSSKQEAICFLHESNQFIDRRTRTYNIIYHLIKRIDRNKDTTHFDPLNSSKSMDDLPQCKVYFHWPHLTRHS